MEKISGILGTSPRLKSTDLQSAHPIRPGAPSFGQPIGEVALAQRKDLSTAQKANILREQMAEDQKKIKEQRTIEDMAAKFFMNQMELRAREPVEMPSTVEIPLPGEGELVMGELEPEEVKFMPKGYYLDKNI